MAELYQCHHLLNFLDMDHKLTEKIQAYLQTESAERDVTVGANLLLALNRNRVMYQNVMRKPEKYAGKVEYELRKHLKIRLDDKTLADVSAMDKIVVPLAKQTIDARLEFVVTKEDRDVAVKNAGKRDDHDGLPDEIKALWNDSAELWFKIKELYETLKTMEKAQPCDRYEYLKLLDESDKKYRANMARYDGYVLGSETSTAKETELEPAEIAKKVQAARKYISDNKKKLAEMKENGTCPDAKYDALLAKVQERFNFLIESGSTISEDQLTELKELGVLVNA